MKKILVLLQLSLLMFLVACGHVPVPEGNYTPPVQKNQPRLLYPKSAQENSTSGNSVVKFLISKAGSVEKIEILESSGVQMLDKAASDYCRNLIFEPATRNGEAVYSVMRLTVKFSVTDYKFDKSAYISEVNYIYSHLASMQAGEKTEAMRELLRLHNNFVANMKDALNFNLYIGQVILPDLANSWQNDWNSWPLSFLLYHDFITRFPDYDSLSLVKIQLANAVKFDLNYIENCVCNDTKEQAGKINIINRVKDFVAKHYPEINLEDFAAFLNKPKPI